MKSNALRFWLAFFWTLFSVESIRAAFPQIVAVDPLVGKPGTAVTIVGNNFGFVTKVFFGQVNAAIVQQVPLTAIVPNGAISGPIYVYNSTGYDDFETQFQVAPSIQSFSPIGGFAGETVVISGKNLSNLDFGVPVGVFFGEVQSPNVFAGNDQSLQVEIPANAVSAPITVVTRAEIATSSQPFLFLPVLLSVTPRYAEVGAKVTLTGSSFAGVKSVYLGGLSTAFSIKSPTNIVFTVPLNAEDGDISLENTAFTSAPVQYRLLPTISSISPSNSPPGKSITILGTGLTVIKSVIIGGKASLRGTSFPPNRVEAVVPEGAETGPVTVITDLGTNTSKVLYFAQPSISSFTPLKAESGEKVKVSGANLLGATEVRIGTNIVEIVETNSKTLVVLVPAERVNGRITIVAPGGEAVSAAAFQFVGAEPQVTGFHPEYGVAGTLVTVTGSKLTQITNVQFGGVSTVPKTTGNSNVTVLVPVGAKNGRIRLAGFSGAAETEREFFVGDQADLELSATFGTIDNSLRTANFSVRNLGPVPGRVVQVSISPGATVTTVAFRPLTGEVEHLGQGLTWIIGTLGVGHVALLEVDFHFDSSGGKVVAQVNSDVEDLRPLNNSLTLTTIPVDTRLRFVRLADRIELRWSIDNKAVLHQTDNLLNPVWTPIATGIQKSGVDNVYVPSSTGVMARFFRLRSPQ